MPCKNKRSKIKMRRRTSTLPALFALQEVEESALHAQGYQAIAGVDEVGRGCLVGNVVAAAVIFPPNAIPDGLTDSKKLTATQRDTWFQIIQKEALAIGIGECTPQEIDELNILWAAMEAMKRAVKNLSLAPDYLLIDGNKAYPHIDLPYQTVVKGDAKIKTIGAASIVAKVTRDRQMADLDAQFPQYGFAQHKGYATLRHYEAIAQYGILPHHRKSFRLTT